MQVGVGSVAASTGAGLRASGEGDVNADGEAAGAGRLGEPGEDGARVGGLVGTTALGVETASAQALSRRIGCVTNPIRKSVRRVSRGPASRFVMDTLDATHASLEKHENELPGAPRP